MEALNRSLYDLKHHDVEIASLRIDVNENFNALTAARKSKLRYFLLTPHDFAEWLQDINKLTNFGLRYRATIEFYEFLVLEYPVAANWYRYIGCVIENEKETLTEKEQNKKNGNNDQIRSSVSVSVLFNRALSVVSCDFKNAHLVYNQYFEYCTRNLQNEDSSTIDSLWKVWLSVLSASHADLENTFKQASSFVSKYYSNSYELHMLQANKVYQRSQKLANYYIKLENAIKTPNLPQPWCDYLEHIATYAEDASTRLRVTLARSRIESEAAGTTQWVPVWLSFLYGTYKLHLDTETHLYNFVRAFPNSAVSYGEYIRSCQSFEEPELKFRLMLDRIEHIDLINTASYDDWKVVALAVLFYEHKALGGVPDHLKLYVNHAFRHNDVFHAVEKLAVSIAAQKDDIKLANSITMDLVRHFPDQCEVWLFAGQFQQAHGIPYKKVAKFYRDAVMECLKMDWPERIIQEALNFELAHGTLDSYNEMMLVANRELKKVLTSPAQLPIDIEPQPNEEKPAARNRESLKIKVENIPKSATENDLKLIFSDCGEIADSVLVDSGLHYEATLEFRTEQALMAALTKDKKAINGQHIAVSQLREAIIWVSNFPPSFSQSEVKALFEDCGQIVSARFPSLKSGRERRFCYLEFTKPESAAAAVKKHNGTKLSDKISGDSFKLVVAISRPPKKIETRKQVMHRQVCVKNLDYYTTESELRTVFEKHGELEEISLPIKKDMRNKGHVNGGYAFVTFKNEPSALNALNADGELIRNRKVHVYKAQPQVSIYNPSDYDDQRTITITGFPDSVRQEQLEAFMAEHFGTVSKSFLDHETGSAVIEFSDFETTKSALQIESTIFDGNTLRVGPKSSFRNPQKGTTTEPKRKLMVPTVVATKRKRTK